MMRIFVLFSCLSLSASLFGAELQIRFDQYAAGETPTNFHRALAGGGEPGVWKIVTDVVPPTLAPLTDKVVIPPRPVLAQLSTDPTDERFPMFVYDGQKFKDFKFTTRFKIISGVAEQMAGVVFRYQNASNFYVLRASALGENFRFYKVVNGIRSDPIGPKVTISTNVWHSLAVQCQGNQIICWLDGALAMPPLNDNTFTVGKIGFWTMSDAVSYFADPVVDYKPLIPAAQTLVNNIMEREPRILELRIYRLDDQGKPKIIASNKPGEVGQPGGDYEHNAIVNGKIFIGHGKGTVSFSMPYRDRNGDPIAAVRIGLKSSFTETQDMAVSRATAILRMMEQQIDNAKDLSQ